MCKLRHGFFPSEESIEQYVVRSAREPFLATDDMTNFHMIVVDDVSEVIGR